MSNPNPENPPDSIVFFQVLSGLIQRNDELYPNDNRVVVDYAVTYKGSKRQVTVSSALRQMDKLN